MSAEITFDTINDQHDQNHIEGCFRTDGGEWKAYCFSHTVGGEMWTSDPRINANAEFELCVGGVEVILPTSMPLNNSVVKDMLCKILNVTNCKEVLGPDSLLIR